jgi:predicted permease
MRAFSSIRTLWDFLLRRSRVEAEMEEEFRSHLRSRADDMERQGISRAEAERQARVEFGGCQRYKEECRDALGSRLLGELIADVRYGMRQLRRNPGFTAVTILTLALGIGANTAIFSLFDAVMLRPLPVRDPAQLVMFRWQARHFPQNKNYFSFGDCAYSFTGTSGCNFPLPVFEEIRSRTKFFSGVAAFAGPLTLRLVGNGPPTVANGELVSGSYFSTLGVRPAIGRLIGPDDDSQTASPVVVLSYAYWERAFGGSKSVIGRTVILGSVPFTIVGVSSRSFTRLSPGKTQDFWLPIAPSRRLTVSFWGLNLQQAENKRTWWVVLLGRLKSGASRAQAQAAASVIFHNEVMNVGGKPMFEPQDDPAVTLVPAQKGLTGERHLFTKALYILMVAVGLILLIACANVAGLLLARGRGRQREMAVRLAVGAGRARIARQLLTESILLSALGGLLGVTFAYWGVRVLAQLMWGHMSAPISFTVGPDWRILAFVVSATLLTGILFGLAPALRGTRMDLTPALKENAAASQESASQSRRWFHLGDALVVAQVGLCVVLLAGAGLLVRTLQNLWATNPGFDRHNLLVFGVDPTSLGYKDAQIRNLYAEMRSHLAALPGVTSVSYSTFPMLANWSSTANVYIEGHSAKSTTVDMVSPGPGFFRTLRQPILEGRAFTAEDFQQAVEANEAESKKKSGPPMPVLVNRMFARVYFPNQSPLGKRIWEDKSRKHEWEIVGVVGNAKITDLRQVIDPTVYVPDTGGQAFFQLRTAGDPSTLIPTVRDLMSRVDTHLPIFDVATQSQEISDTLDDENFNLVVRGSSVFGFLGLLLASVGLYGLLSFEVGRRTREIGIRMALGARKDEVLAMIARQGLKLTLIGLTIGIAGAYGLTRFMSSLLYGVRPTDPLTFIAVALILFAVALVACYVPARRAAKVDPMVALRWE